VTKLRAELQEVLRALLDASSAGGEVSLDAIGEALGARAASTEEIDTLFAALEARKRRIVGPEGGGGEQRLKCVVDAARALTAELGHRPKASEVAARAELTVEQVQHTLALLRVMQRG
jgi:hypothetical protein